VVGVLIGLAGAGLIAGAAVGRSKQHVDEVPPPPEPSAGGDPRAPPAWRLGIPCSCAKAASYGGLEF
jgi:hypothetical protein